MNRVTTSQFFLILSLFAGFFCPSQAPADSIKGEIATVGDPSTRKTIIKPESGGTAVTICPGPRVFELTQLAGTITSIDGSMKKLPKSVEACIDVQSFKIQDIAPGRPAIVGNLKMIEKGQYAIVNPDGKVWRLAKLAPGLKEYLNMTLVLDLVANDASSKETTWLVARSFAMPTP